MKSGRRSRFLILASLVAALLLMGFFASPARDPAQRSSMRAPAPPSPAARGVSAAEVATGEAPAESAGKSSCADFAAWAEGFDPQTAAPAELQRGVALAERRAQELMTMIINDPERALSQALPASLRRKLPPEVARRLERRVDGHGALAVAIATPPPGRGRVELSRTVTVNGATYRAHVYGRRLSQSCKENIPLHGIALGGELALHESPLRVLEPGEGPDPAKPLANPDFVCPVKGVVSRNVAVDAGDTIYYTCCTACPEELSAQLVAAEGQPGPAANGGDVAASSWTEGPKSLLIMRVDFPDKPGEPTYYNYPYTSLSVSFAQSLAALANSFFQDNSYGKTSIPSCTVTSTVLRMPKTSSSYFNDVGLLSNDARPIAKAAGYDSANFNLDMVCCCYLGGAGGQAFVGAKGCALYGGFDTLINHELGHNYGVWHANYWTGDPTGTSAGSNEEYGDAFDIMGASLYGIGSERAHFNAYSKSVFNWLTSTQVRNVTASGTYRIYAFDQALGSNVGAFKVAKSGDPSGRIYWGGFRQKVSDNPYLMNGLDLHWAPWASSNGGTHQLDTTYGSPNGKTDAPIAIGKTFSDTAAGIHITPIRKGGTTPESLDVVVNIGSFSGNAAPSVAVSANPTSVAPGVPVTLSATASDPNGDPLAYYWDLGDGAFGTNAPSLSKSWSAWGNYTVTCTVTDMKGGTASASTVVNVSNATPPVAQNQNLVTPPNTPRSIILLASDANNDPLTYSIVSTPAHGALSGAAPNVTYTPASGYLGSDSFTFKANDGSADSNVATVSLTVSNVDPSLVLHWKLDESSGATASDASGQGNTGTLLHSPPWTAGKVNGGLAFDGVNNQYAISDRDLAGNFAGRSVTLVVWFRASAPGVLVDELGSQTTNSGWHDSLIEVLGNGEVRVGVWNLPSLSLGTVAWGQWNHAVLRYDQAAQRLDGFLNGLASATSVSGAKQWPGTLYYALAAQDSTNLGSGAWFNGTLDEFRVYNRALSASEIASLANQGGPVNQAPVAYNQSIGTAQNTSTAITLSASDPDGNPLTYSLVTNPAHGSLSGAAPNFTYSPGSNYNGPDSFSFKANDGQTDSNSATVSITVTPVNNPPTAVASASPTSGFAPLAVGFDGSASSDSDGAIASYAWNFGDGANGSGITASHTYATPGAYTVTLMVTDNSGASAFTGLTITVNSNPNLTVHIASIAMSLNLSRSGNSANAAVLIVDASGTPQANATVNGTWSGLTNGSQAKTTGANGSATFTSAKSKKSGTFTVTVTSVSLPGYSYDPSQNVKSSNWISSSGVSGSAAGVAQGTGGAPIDLGTIGLGQKVLIPLEVPDELAGQRARWRAVERTDLPPGLRVRRALLSGTPKAPGSFGFDLKISAKDGEALRSYTVRVAP